MLSEIREKTARLIEQSCDAEQPVLVEAPPASGKTHSAVRLAQDSERRVLYLAGRTDLYEQAIEEAQDAGDIYFQTIPSPYRDCRTFKDENNGQTQKARRMYEKGKTGREIHYAGQDTVHMPCQTGGDCEYIRKLNAIEYNSGWIDLLIGNHQHAYSTDYLEGRTVVFDEFNIDPFVTQFPSSESSIRDTPGKVVKPFLESVEELPFNDLTDLIEARVREGEDWERAMRWFIVETDESMEELVDISPAQYDTTHRKSALIACSLLRMEDLGSGIEFAHAPELWRQIGVNENLRCIRDRNSGEMTVLEPPPLDEAEQVIGLDALPVKRLWEAVLGCEFTHECVRPREELDEYLEDVLNLEIRQVANGANHYSSGKISSKDKQRFAVIRALEEQRYPVITRKQALSAYKSRDWFKNCVEHADDDADKTLRARQYAKVLSSNVFGEDSLGLVSGSPFPGDDVVKRWAALCGEPTEPIRSGEEPSTGESLAGFEGFGDKIYRHLTHNQVAQAIFRFGRDVPKDRKTTVYVNTTALPDWLPAAPLWINDLQRTPKRTHILEALINATVQQDPPEGMTAKQLRQEASERLNDDGDITYERVRQILQDEVKECVRVEESAGKYGADLFFWEADERVKPLPEETAIADRLVKIGPTIHLLRPR
jgi:hypothetical protein